MATGTESPAAARMPFLDLLRALASQVIVLHHLSLYGPMPVDAQAAAPALLDGLFDYGRMAVSVFFVVGGYFAARALDLQARPGPGQVAGWIGRRYLRIGVPYLATLALAVGANALCRDALGPEVVSASPSAGQLLAHALFLHDILGYEALSAGIWYLAIDFQLGLLVTLLFALAGRLRRPAGGRLAQALLGALAIASLFVFNRDPRLEIWAIYFVGTFFLGVVLQWSLSGRLPAWAFWAYLGLTALAVAYDFRTRLVVAAATALAIWAAARLGGLERWPRNRLVSGLGRISYALFLVHYPVCLLVSAAYARTGPHSARAAVGAMLGAWALSVAVAAAFHRLVEARCARAASLPARVGGAL